MKIPQVVIHIVYWVSGFLFISWAYTLLGPWATGIIYALMTIPMIIAFAYFLIYWAVPSFLFKGHTFLFSLLSGTLGLAILNIQFFVVFTVQVYFSANFPEDLTILRTDILFLLTSTLIVTLPAIYYETVRHWNKEKKRSMSLEKERKRVEEFLNQTNDQKPDHITVQSSRKKYRLFKDKIRFIESYGDYSHIHLPKDKVISRITLKELEEALPEFVRVHRSFIINPIHCQAYNKVEVIIEGIKIPVGKTYKDLVSQTLK